MDDFTYLKKIHQIFLPIFFQRDIISIQVGQAGTQIGVSCWELYCLEHGIDACGYMVANYDDCRPLDENYTTFFHYTESGKNVPRTVFIDLEPSVIGI